MVKSIPASILAAVLLAGGLQAAAAAAREKGTAPEYRLRGVGILILDPRDPPDLVKEQLRLFVEQLRPNVPEEYRQEANRLQLEALLEADWQDGQDLPQLDLVIHPDVTVDMIRDYFGATPIGLHSDAVCPAACPLRGHPAAVIHIHLTRSENGTGDSIIAFRFYGGAGEGNEVPPQEARMGHAFDLGRGFVEDYSLYGYDREPITKVFGVGVVVGEPRVPRDGRGPDEDP